MSDDFFKTRMGQAFYESTMPNIATQLKRIADSLAASVPPSVADLLEPVTSIGDRHRLELNGYQSFTDDERSLILEALAVLSEVYDDVSKDMTEEIRALKRKVAL